MAVDPSIALGVRAPQIPQLEIQSPLERFQRVQTLRNLMTQGQLGQLNLDQTRLENQKLQQGIDADIALRGLFKPGVTPSESDIYGVAGFKAPAFVKERHQAEEARLKALGEKTARLGELAGTMLDKPELFTSTIMQAQSEGLLTPDQARGVLGGGYNRDQIEQFANQALTRKQQIDVQLDQAKAVREEAESALRIRKGEAELPGIQAEALQKNLNRDAMILSAAAARGPEVLNAEIAKLPADRQAIFAGATTPRDILMRAVAPKVGETLPYPTPVLEQKQAIARAGVPGEASDEALIQTTIANPSLFQEYQPKTQERLAPRLAELGFTQFGKPPGEAALTKQSDLRSALGGLDQLETIMRGPGKTFIGPVAGLLARDPSGRLPGAVDAKAVQAQVDLIKQRIGKALEGGVLRKEDEEKYKRILPTMTDPFDTAMKKIEQLRMELNRDLQTFEAQQRRGGRALPEEPTPVNRISVIGPDGKRYSLRADQWEEAQKRGFRKQ